MAKPTTEPADEQRVEGKGRPTPTRAEREAERRRPLVADTKEARKRARAEMNEKRERARVGMANGEARYLPPRDQGPQRRFVRDYVDARWHIAELVMPMMIVVIVLLLVNIPAIMVYAYLLLWAYVIVAVVDMVITGIRARKAAARRFGDDKVEKGLRWYAAMRVMQFRPLRLPKPQVARGATLD